MTENREIWSEKTSAAIESLLLFAVRRHLLDQEDVAYARNGLLDLMKLDAPAQVKQADLGEETATTLLNQLVALAREADMIGDMQYEADQFTSRAMGLLTPAPTQVRQSFAAAMNRGDPVGATDAFYDMCRACDYIKVDAIAQNVRYFADSPAGELEITINLSKPEKDPREIAKLKNAPSVGYPRCMLCTENPGYAGRSNFPARFNHRIVPLMLAGARWYLQYSPYAYYPEHCIVFNGEHVPMAISRGTFERLFSFVSQFPHYFLGSNADLPIVGGSILNHDHFQGGRYTFPMDHAGTKLHLHTDVPGVDASILDWPMSTLALSGKDPDALIALADRLLKAWRGYTDAACDVLAETDGQPHNTITPILRKVDGVYRLLLVLRNNRTSEEHPLGIFHPHAPLHHIKKENIGLIEVMGLFILPGRLKTELNQLCPYLTGEEALTAPDETDPRFKHFAWISQIVQEHGLCMHADEAEALIRSEVAKVCAQVLADAGVYKQDEAGLEGMLRFLATVGMTKA